MLEILYLFRSLRRLTFIPVLGWVTPFLYLGYLQISGKEGYLLHSFLGNVLPIFASLWVIFSLQEPRDKENGEIFYVYRRHIGWWIRRTSLLFLIYTLPAVGVSLLTMLWVGPIGWGLIVRIVSLCWFYTWLAFFAMNWTNEVSWSTFAVILVFFVSVYGRQMSQFPFNVHHFSITDYFTAIPYPMVVRVGIVSGVLILLAWARQILILKRS